jgi:hypothetical protein
MHGLMNIKFIGGFVSIFYSSCFDIADRKTNVSELNCNSTWFPLSEVPKSIISRYMCEDLI